MLSFAGACVAGLLVGRWWSAPGPSRPGGRLVPLVWLAAATQLAVSLVPASVREDVRGPALLVANVLVGAFLAVNARPGRFQWAARVALVGWTMNALVVAANGAMPVSMHAVDRVGLAVDDVSVGFLYEHENAGPDTVLPWLADVIPLPLGPERSVISPGDVLLLASVALAVATATGRRAPNEIREEVNA